jgi:hypothetical protein
MEGTMYYNGKAPCYGCSERAKNCHDNCKKYIEWKAEYDRKKNTANAIRRGSEDVSLYQAQVMYECKKRRNK